MIAYFNGNFLPKNEVHISPDDRGFLFADGLYEIIRTYRGTLFRAKEHIERLNSGATFLNLPIQDFSYLKNVATQLLEKNEIKADATIYLQVTRGVAPRNHSFPDPVIQPTVFAIASPFDPLKGLNERENGIRVILAPDQRWARCDIKTLGLTLNVLASQLAKEKGAQEALFVKDGVILEGSRSNFMAVIDDCLLTYPASNYILNGITRRLILELCAQSGIPFREAPIFVSDLPRISEAFITGSTAEITPIVSIYGSPIGSQKPGPITRKLQDAFVKAIASSHA